MLAAGVILAALASPSNILGGDMQVGSIRGGALRASALINATGVSDGTGPAPTFELSFSGGAAQVATSQTINATAVGALWIYDLANCDGTDCDATAGTNLPITGGTAPTTGLPGPAEDARGVSFITGQAEYAAASTATGDVTTEDLLAMAVFRYSGTTTTIAEKREGAGSELGYALLVNAAGRLELIADDGAGAPSATSAVLTADAFYCCSCYIDRDDATTDGGRCYCNNTAGPAAAATSSGSATNAEALTLGADSQGGTEFDGALAYAGLWAQSSWYPGGASNPTQWAAHHLDACGDYQGFGPTVANGDDSPTVLSRASTAYVAQYESANTRTRLALVANDWIRVSCRDEGFDSGGAAVCGLLREEGETNLLTHSEEFDHADWTKDDLTVTADATVAPNGEQTADDLICSTLASEDHFIIQGPTVATPIASIFAKAGAVDHIIIRTGGGNGSSQFFNVSTCTVGSNDNNGTADVLAAYAEDWGDGWCRVTSVTQNSTRFNVYTASADASFNYACSDMSSAQLSIWGAQAENRSPTRQPASSYIATAGTTISRSADDIRWAGASNVDDVGAGSAHTSILARSWTVTEGDYFVASLSNGATPATDSVVQLIDLATPDAFQTIGYVATGTEWDIAGTTDLTDAAAHTVITTWQSNEAKAFVDGAQEGSTDNAVTAPSGIDRIELAAREDGAERFGELVTNVILYGAVVSP